MWQKNSAEGTLPVESASTASSGKNTSWRAFGHRVRLLGNLREILHLPAKKWFPVARIPFFFFFWMKWQPSSTPTGDRSPHTALSFGLSPQKMSHTGAGPTGLMAAAIAPHAGARNVVVTDLSDYRLNLAKKLAPQLP